MDENDLVILFTDSNQMVVQNVQDILENSGIPSVHISSGFKSPFPTGLRVRYRDYKKSKKLIEGIELKPLKKISEPPKSFMKAQRVGIIVYFVAGLLFFLYTQFK